jgi:hypothetical protein
MTKLSFLTEAELLETFRISLENARNQSEIAEIRTIKINNKLNNVPFLIY